MVIYNIKRKLVWNYRKQVWCENMARVEENVFGNSWRIYVYDDLQYYAHADNVGLEICKIRSKFDGSDIRNDRNGRIYRPK